MGQTVNIDQTFCASYCKNYKCPKMLSYSKVKAAEKQRKEIKHSDLSAECKDYKD